MKNIVETPGDAFFLEEEMKRGTFDKITGSGKHLSFDRGKNLFVLYRGGAPLTTTRSLSVSDLTWLRAEI